MKETHQWAFDEHVTRHPNCGTNYHPEKYTHVWTWFPDTSPAVVDDDLRRDTAKINRIRSVAKEDQ
jgi:hypothetical protein